MSLFLGNAKSKINAFIYDLNDLNDVNNLNDINDLKMYTIQNNFLR